ncbi:hypothetical protein CRE_23365 [Caenorhabditis remanei]|uniref:Uncharacterized protein n=1 Tax=Caenorhabditis remanei TaxID=31234 RepID=E3MH40_CAERE|nr:hypothetical protein CRE_23365 [Caenorhabditis remanei]
MPDSVSHKESSFEFLNDSDASDRELEQVVQGVEQDIQPETHTQSEVRKRTSQVSTAPPPVIAPAKPPSTATNRIKGILFCLILILLCAVSIAHLCSLIKDLKQQQDLRNSKILAKKLQEDQIIEELGNVKRDLQNVIDRAMKDRKDSFNNIKCLEDIPEELMSKWTPDEWESRGVKQFILDNNFDEDVHWFLRKAHPLLTKLSEDYQMQFQWVKEELTLNSILLEGPCVYTAKDGSTKVFVKEGLLYVKSKYSYKKEKKEFTLVYSIPKEYQ